MKAASGHLAVEVELSVNDVPFAEYDAGKDGVRDLSCYVGNAAGQHPQINLRFKGPWMKALCDIVSDGVLCRVVAVEGSGPMSKFVDQVSNTALAARLVVCLKLTISRCGFWSMISCSMHT